MMNLNKKFRDIAMGVAAFSVATVSQPVGFRQDAFAQTSTERVLGTDAYAGNRVSQEAALSSLGGRPVRNAENPFMTRESATQTVASFGNRASAENGAALVETFTFLGAQGRGSAFARELANAQIDATTGDSEFVDVTDAVEAMQEGDQIAEGMRVRVRRAAFDSRRVFPGMTFRGPDGRILFDPTERRLRGGRDGESTEGMEIQIVSADGSTQLVPFFDDCDNSTIYEVVPAPIAETIENPCPPRINVPVEGLPEGSLVTVVFAFEDGERPIPTVDNDTCPTSSLPEVCRDCTAGVARAAELELEERYNKEYGVLTAGTTRVMGGEIHIDIPPVYRVQLETGEIINIDVRRALDNETLLMYISCPREERGRREIGEGQSATLRRADWAQAERAADGSLTLPLEFRQRQGVYRLENE